MHACSTSRYDSKQCLSSTAAALAEYCDRKALEIHPLLARHSQLSLAAHGSLADHQSPPCRTAQQVLVCKPHPHNSTCSNNMHAALSIATLQARTAPQRTTPKNHSAPLSRAQIAPFTTGHALCCFQVTNGSLRIQFACNDGTCHNLCTMRAQMWQCSNGTQEKAQHLQQQASRFCRGRQSSCCMNAGTLA
jgi:hypothetical protein